MIVTSETLEGTLDEKYRKEINLNKNVIRCLEQTARMRD